MICYFDDECSLCRKTKEHYEQKFKKVLWIGLSKTTYSKESMIVFKDKAYTKEKALKLLLKEANYPLKIFYFVPNFLLKISYEFFSRRRFFFQRFF